MQLTNERGLKKQIPNFLTTLRILTSISLIVWKPLSGIFLCLYMVAGVTDMLDGFLARKLNAASRFGEKYDSLADVIFVGICFIKLIPVLQLKLWHWIWLGLIVLIKISNLLFSHLYHRNKLFLHTIANKITGFMLFLSPLFLGWVPLDYIFIILCVIATFAAIQEGHYIRRGKV